MVNLTGRGGEGRGAARLWHGDEGLVRLQRDLLNPARRTLDANLAVVHGDRLAAARHVGLGLELLEDGAAEADGVVDVRVEVRPLSRHTSR